MRNILSITIWLLLTGLLVSCSNTKEHFVHPDHLYKITTLDLWNDSQGQSRLTLSSIDSEFIHFAEEGDVERIRSKFFSEEETVVVLKIDRKKLPGRLVKERNPGGSKEYYHLYDGLIPMDAVLDVEERSY